MLSSLLEVLFSMFSDTFLNVFRQCWLVAAVAVCGLFWSAVSSFWLQLHLQCFYTTFKQTSWHNITNSFLSQQSKQPRRSALEWLLACFHSAWSCCLVFFCCGLFLSVSSGPNKEWHVEFRNFKYQNQTEVLQWEKHPQPLGMCLPDRSEECAQAVSDLWRGWLRWQRSCSTGTNSWRA